MCFGDKSADINLRKFILLGTVPFIIGVENWFCNVFFNVERLWKFVSYTNLWFFLF